MLRPERPEEGTPVRTAGSVLLALALTLGIHLGGSALGGQLLHMSRAYRVELFDRAAEEGGALFKVVSDEGTRQVAAKYVAALADAVVRFEFFPRGEDAAVFLGFLSALPEDVAVNGLAFSGRSLSIDCTAAREEALREFALRLKALDGFAGVSLELHQKKDGAFAGVVTCIAN